MTFGERLKELREAAGLTQAAMWDATGLPRKTYLNYEQSRVVAVPYPAVVALAKALGVDCTAFAACDYSPIAEVPTAKPAKKGKTK